MKKKSEERTDTLQYALKNGNILFPVNVCDIIQSLLNKVIWMPCYKERYKANGTNKKTFVSPQKYKIVDVFVSVAGKEIGSVGLSSIDGKRSFSTIQIYKIEDKKYSSYLSTGFYTREACRKECHRLNEVLAQI